MLATRFYSKVNASLAYIVVYYYSTVTAVAIQLLTLIKNNLPVPELFSQNTKQAGNIKL